MVICKHFYYTTDTVELSKVPLHSFALIVSPSSGRGWYCLLKILHRCPSVQGSGVPGKAEQDQKEHLGSQQTRCTAVDYAVYVHGL